MPSSAPRKASLITVGDMSRMLAAHAPQIAAEIFPNGVRDCHEWRVGSLAGERGQSLAVHLWGSKAGVWRDFAAGIGGDLIDLATMALCQGDKAAGIGWARRWLGIDSARPDSVTQPRPAMLPPAQNDNAEAEAEIERVRAAARRIWFHATPAVLGTPVDRYLAGRGIVLAELARMPKAIRYHPSLWHQQAGAHFPAMVVAITGADGRFVAVHRTWLDATTSPVRKAKLEKNKMVLGRFSGGHIPIARGQSGRSLRDALPGETVDITEGIEDALSVALIAPEARVLAAVSLGNLAGVVLPPAITAVRLWREADTKLVAIEAADRAISAYLAAGRAVFVPPMPAGAKDANDILRGART